jgi:hypothetical protein
MRFMGARHQLYLLLLLLGLGSCEKKDEQASVTCQDINLVQPNEPNFNLLPPNAISPNGDGMNDVFILLGEDKVTHSMTPVTAQNLRVYRASSTTPVYEKQNYTNEFNGHDASGNELPEGSYRYEAKLNNSTASGSLVIVRTSKTCNCRVVDPSDPYLDNICK